MYHKIARQYLTKNNKQTNKQKQEFDFVVKKKLTGVPLTLVEMPSGVVPLISGAGASLEIPKSEIFTFKFWSSSMLFVLMSRWKIGGFASV